MPWWAWLIIIWFFTGIALGLLIGRCLHGISRHYPTADPVPPRPTRTDSGHTRTPPVTTTCKEYRSIGGTICTTSRNCPFKGPHCAYTAVGKFERGYMLTPDELAEVNIYLRTNPLPPIYQGD